MVEKSDFDKIEHPKKRAFLTAFAEQGTVTSAAIAAGCGRTSHYDWLAGDKEYALLFEGAKGMAADALVEEARKRAMDGSDTLLIFLMKGAMPETYRERHTIDGNIQHSLTVSDILNEAEQIESGVDK